MEYEPNIRALRKRLRELRYRSHISKEEIPEIRRDLINLRRLIEKIQLTEEKVRERIQERGR